MFTFEDRRQVSSLVPSLLVFGFFANLGMLVSPLFMMQLLDRVVPSGNMATLALLLIVAVFTIAVAAFIEARRTRLLKAIGLWAEARFLTDARATEHEVSGLGFHEAQSLRSPSRIASTLALFDTPWLLLFCFVLFVLSPWFLLLIAFAIVLVCGVRLLFATNGASPGLVEAEERAALETTVALGSLQGMMGLGKHLSDRALVAAAEGRKKRRAHHQSTARLHAHTQFLRQSSQVGMLALGGTLVSLDMLSAGGMIAASLIGSKALSLAENGVQSLPEFRETLSILAPQSEERSNEPGEGIEITSGSLKVDALTVPKGRTGGFRLQNVSFDLGAGQCLAVLGPSGSGKSSLLTYLSGAFAPPLGQVRLDGQDVSRIDTWIRQKMVGFMPQIPTFHHGNVFEIISCFDPNATADDVENAAIKAGVHSTILGLPNAYQTDLAKEAFLLSAGQMQRLALARALFHNPVLLLLDEPNALQDSLGEQQMADALSRVKAEGCTIIMVVHRAGIMSLADSVLVLDHGRVVDFGPRAHVLARRSNPTRTIDLPLTEGGVQDVEDWITNQFQRRGDEDIRYRAVLVGTELYNFMRANGPAGTRRSVRMQFAFTDAGACKISIREEDNSALNARVSDLKKVVGSKSWRPEDLSDGDMAMVLLAEATEALDVLGENKATELVATLNAALSQRAMRPN